MRQDKENPRLYTAAPFKEFIKIKHEKGGRPWQRVGRTVELQEGESIHDYREVFMLPPTK